MTGTSGQSLPEMLSTHIHIFIVAVIYLSRVEIALSLTRPTGTRNIFYVHYTPFFSVVNILWCKLLTLRL